jgi:hypothetical protein
MLGTEVVVMSQRVVTVTEVLDGHMGLDIQCADRIYLNCYVPKLQTSAQVVAFLSDHLGYPFPSPALFRKLGEGFRKAVATFAAHHHIPVVRFGKDDVGSKLDLMRPYLDRQAATGHSGVAAIGVAQEFQRVWTAYERQTSTGTTQWWFTKDDRRVSCYNRLLIPLTAADQPQAPRELRQALRTLDHHVDDYIARARLKPASET